MATKKKSDGSGIQQAAGLIRYFDEESEESWKITPAQVYLACILLGVPGQPGRGSSDHEPVLNSQRLNQYDPLVALRHATRHFKRRGEVLGNTQHFLPLVGLKHQTVGQLVKGRRFDALKDPMFVLNTDQRRHFGQRTHLFPDALCTGRERGKVPCWPPKSVPERHS